MPAVANDDDDFVLNFAVTAPPPAARTLDKANAYTKDRPLAVKSGPLKPHTVDTSRSAATTSAATSSKQSTSPDLKHTIPKNAASTKSSVHKNLTVPKPRPERTQPIDEDNMRGADDDEDGDVAEFVAMALRRDEQLQQELTSTGRPLAGADRVGVVEFDDDSEAIEAKRAAKRQRTHAQAGSTKPALAGGQQKQPSVDGAAAAAAVKVAAPTVRHVPGRRQHADVSVPSDAAEQIFGIQPAAVAECTRNGAAESSGRSWEGLGVCPSLIQQLRALKFAAPTVTQQGALPPMLAGKDVLIRAPTGSGKTLSYLIPLVNDLMNQQPKISRGEGTYAVVVAPVRELCIQINDVATSLLRPFWWLIPGMIIGGENRSHEKARLRKGITVLTASPGRLIDHLQNTTAFQADQLRWLVLDEADRLLDLGFQAKLQEICGLLDKRASRSSADSEGGTARRRQTVLLSATLHAQLSSLAAVSLHDPVAVGFNISQAGGRLQVGVNASSAPPHGTKGHAEAVKAAAAAAAAAEEETFSVPSQLRQSYLQVNARDRLMALAALLRQRLVRTRGGAGAKVVVFLSSCDAVEFHAQLLGPVWARACGGGLLPEAAPLLQLHGDMPQAQRTAAFCTFAEAQSGVLLCTDVAARGLDFPAVSTIIQYDVPGATAEYIHRVGRTARMGHAGEALLFLLPTEADYVKLLQGRGIELKASEAGEALLKWLPLLQADAAATAAAGGGGGSGRGRGVGEGTAWRLTQRLLATVAADPQLKQLASDAFRSYVRAYAAHGAEVKKIFHVRQLHLGHAAYSFALRETPTMLGQSGSAVERKRKKAEAAESLKRRHKKNWNVAAAAAAGQNWHRTSTATANKGSGGDE